MKNILKKFWPVLLILILAIPFYILYDRSRQYQEVYDRLYIGLFTDTVEYGSDYDADDLVAYQNGYFYTDSVLDTHQMGEQILTYVVWDRDSTYHQEIKKSFDIPVTVIDTVPPVIELNKETVYVYVGNDYDLKENVKRVFDVVDGDIAEYEASSDLDTSKVGDYEAKIKATDKNGLTTEASYMIKVRNQAVSGGVGYEMIYDILTSTYGYNKAAACGILANIRFESNFDPDVGDYYYGLCQWGGSRKDALFSFCSANGYDATSIEGQLIFLEHELNTSYTSVKSYLQGIDNTANGAYNAAEYFCNHYEGAASSAGRGDLAMSYFES